MGFTYRKSVNLGPFRVNLSNSSLGYSVGRRGLSDGTTARGKKIRASASTGPELAIANRVLVALLSSLAYPPLSISVADLCLLEQIPHAP
jgi:hypothetical protein